MIQPKKDNQSNKPGKNNGNWMRYLSYGIQLMATIGIGLFLGYKADKALKISIPLLIWLLPTFLLVYMLVKLVKDFTKNGKDKELNGKSPNYNTPYTKSGTAFPYNCGAVSPK